MPTQLQPLRRSGRNSGKKIASPQYKHDLFTDPPPIRSNKKKTVVKKKQKKQVKSTKKVTDDLYVPDEEEEEVEEVVVDQPIGSHPSKNYTKLQLYDRWVRSRNEATDNKNELEDLQKQSRRDQKEINRLEGEVDRMEAQVSNLQDKLEKKQAEVKNLQSDKKNSKNGVSNTAIIQNMKATYDHLTSKNEFQHKTELCELNLKFKELQVMLENSNDKIARLEEENKNLKKNNCNVRELKVASLKSEIQIQSMQEKNCIR